MNAAPLRFMATAPRGLADLVAREIRAASVADVQRARRRRALRGSLRAGTAPACGRAWRAACCWRWRDFQAPDTDAFYAGARAIDWRAHLDPRGTLACEFTGAHPTITHTQFGALKLKDAICDQLRATSGARPDIDLRRPDVRVHRARRRPRVLLYIDLAGEGLHRRGYRLRAARRRCARIWRPASCCAPAGRRSPPPVAISSIPCAARARCRSRRR